MAANEPGQPASTLNAAAVTRDLAVPSSALAIGAHPSYPDRVGFGRQELQMEADELVDAILAAKFRIITRERYLIATVWRGHPVICIRLGRREIVGEHVFAAHIRQHAVALMHVAVVHLASNITQQLRQRPVKRA